VYVDGALRGTAPAALRLEPGQHGVRVNSPGLDRSRAADVQMSPGSSGRLDFDRTRQKSKEIAAKRARRASRFF